ncbi:N-acetylglucosaminyldiphosphoundecaprenol N-acetyl-beta-D-mannosaminyltransferase [Bacteroides luti]|uniref:N-acetylglucosaminyldiphosphoundecaprenol N-acetyl-beta-D-mannosaminyltransferase n=1 Tax=Bacteroides luti TaxID=1297750 RepID=A0A1M4SSP3_9BACE|nr:WecB/TagA/CpsF family glycosyltransferase [Bacteroides luti]SHE35273.1 N-acetylglucosaminyldiphosphoundecaprenol N-acetyl-beta-D-mannosaminyltransferase [Bacteroides luti]
MKKYFNVNLEFNKDVADQIIERTIEHNRKGYVCAIEANNLAIANQNKKFNETLNSSLVNVCDGSNIAWLLGKIYKKHFCSYIGNDLFINFVNKGKYRQYFLGNTDEVLTSLKINLCQIDPTISEMCFSSLPFSTVEDFDYSSIAEHINSDSPDIIWVSLGAPKQELFMKNLLPYLNKGVMFGIGAVFNFNSSVGKVRRAPKWILKLRMEWFYRALEEPKKNIPRYWNFIKLLPKLIYIEFKHISKSVY